MFLTMPFKREHNSISTGTIIRFFVVLLGLLFIYFIRDLIASLVFAIIIASAFEPAVAWVQERGLPRIMGVISVYIGIGLFFFLIIYLVFPLLIEEVTVLFQTYPLLQERILSGISLYSDKFPLLVGNLPNFVDNKAGYLGILSGSIANISSAVFGGAYSLILVFIFSLYLLAQEHGIERFLRLITPLDSEPYVISLWQRAQKKLGRWFRTQLLLGVLVGFLIFFGLTIIGVKDALLLALLAAVLELIPVVGPIIAAVPAIALSLVHSLFLGVVVAVLYVVVQQLESNVIVPVVMRNAVGLSPLVVILALLIGARLGGPFGLLLAVPIMAVLAEIVSDWDEKKRAILPE